MNLGSLPLQFPIYNNFHLFPNDWGEGRHDNIIALLASVIKDFYSVLDADLVPRKAVIVVHKEGNPQYILNFEYDIIFLSATNLLWAQYCYQFSHEMCHYVIASNWFQTQSKFGWFEEVLCELNSIFLMRKMSQSWLVMPPYENWKNYAYELGKYIETTIDAYKIDLSILTKDWFKENNAKLEADRYLRDKNIYLALKLLPAFTSDPQLWQTIQYLKLVPVDDHMSFGEFLVAWRDVIADDLKSKFHLITDVCNFESA